MPRKTCVIDPFKREKFWPSRRRFDLMRRFHQIERSAGGEWYLCSQSARLIDVIGEYGVVFKVPSEQLEKMRDLGQVEPTGLGECRLSEQGKWHVSKTRISNGKRPTDAMGLSQDYTEREGRGWKFREIDPVDRPAFQLGALFHDDHLFNDAKEAEERAQREREAAEVRRKNKLIAWAIDNLRQRDSPDMAWVNADSTVTVAWFKCDSAASVGFT